MHNTLKDLLPGPGNSLDTRRKITVKPRKGGSFVARFVRVNGDNNAKMKIVDTGEITSFSLNTAACRN